MGLCRLPRFTLRGSVATVNEVVSQYPGERGLVRSQSDKERYCNAKYNMLWF